MKKKLIEIIIAADHAGYDLKSYLVHHISDMILQSNTQQEDVQYKSTDIIVYDIGTNTDKKKVDYPYYASKLATIMLSDVPILMMSRKKGIITTNEYKQQCVSKYHNNVHYISDNDYESHQKDILNAEFNAKFNTEFNTILPIQYKEYKKFGVLICYTGIGMSIAANRYRHIRSALCYNIDLAILARQHNDANVLALGAMYTKYKQAAEILNAFLHTDFLNEARYQHRIEMMDNI